MQGLPARLVLGFIAAAIAVVTVHEGIIYVLTQSGVIRGTAWGMQPIPPWGVPRLINNIFWGGLWGALFAAVYERVPGEAPWLKGLIFGLFIVVVSNWILLPLIKGQIFGQPGQVLFGNWEPRRMLATLAIVGGFGLALGVIYSLMRPRDTT
jgi:hypothetical protein